MQVSISECRKCEAQLSTISSFAWVYVRHCCVCLDAGSGCTIDLDIGSGRHNSGFYELFTTSFLSCQHSSRICSWLIRGDRWSCWRQQTVDAFEWVWAGLALVKSPTIWQNMSFLLLTLLQCQIQQMHVHSGPTFHTYQYHSMVIGLLQKALSAMGGYKPNTVLCFTILHRHAQIRIKTFVLCISGCFVLKRRPFSCKRKAVCHSQTNTQKLKDRRWLPSTYTQNKSVKI